MTLFELTSVYDLTSECYRFSQRLRMRCTRPDATAVTSRVIKSHSAAAEMDLGLLMHVGKILSVRSLHGLTILVFWIPALPEQHLNGRLRRRLKY